MEDPISLAGAFLLGAILGSFLNAAIYRLPRYISLINPARSFCPKCDKPLSWRENVPLFSWLFQRGKCKHCQNPIPVQYFVVELISGIAGAGSYLTFGNSPTGWLIFILLLVLITISFIDLEHKIIPDRISIPGMTIGLILGIVSQYTDLFRCRPFQALCPVTQDAYDSLLGFAIGGGFFWSIGWIYFLFTKKEGLGFGDVKLMAMTGAILGIQSIIPTVILGSLSGAIIGIMVMVATGGGRHTEIPFGPWLALGTVIYIFFDPAFFHLVQ